MQWATVKYSKSQVDKAGDHLASMIGLVALEVSDEYIRGQLAAEAFDILNNWRASHAFPLNTIQMWLRRIAKSVDKNALVAQRLKRSSSIVTKLLRFPKMNLSRMQDIGGCRAVVSSVSKVKEIQAKFKESETRHELCGGSDYIENPKEDGYRGVHLIYKYDSDNRPEYDGLRIEIQVRSRLMHCWATAVETVDTFTKQSLKTDQGEEEWKSFFKCIGSAFAVIEKTPLVPGTPQDREELKTAIIKMEKDLKVISLMTAYNMASAVMELPDSQKAHYFLLTRDSDENRLQISGYLKEELEEANADYLRYEKEFQGGNRQAVLVSVDSVDSLKKAYPNYYGDTQEFVSQLKAFIGLDPMKH